MENTTIRAAIEATSDKTQLALAQFLEVKQPVVSRMLYSEKVPVGHCLRIHDLTGIPLHDIRPDIYPKPSGDKVDQAA